MSDPLWFLENTEEDESKSDQNDFTLNFETQLNPGQKEWIPEKVTKFPADNSEQSSTKPTQTTQVLQLDVLNDEESLRTAIQNSLLEAIKDGNKPEIQITVNSKPQNVFTSNTLEDNLGGTVSEKDKSKMVITLNKAENGQVVGEEKKFVINSQSNEVDQNSATDQRPTVYMILPNENKSTLEGENSNTRYLEEAGSTVINLNDLVSSKGNAISGKGDYTANIDLSSVIGSSEGFPKMQLVINVKDERDQTNRTTHPEENSLKSYSDSDIARLKELLKNSATLESLDSEIQSEKEVRNIPITVTPPAPSTRPSTSTWQTYNFNSDKDAVNSQKSSAPLDDWVDKSTDSYVRRDGAQCTRTVWTTPQGRRVETKCFKDERTSPRDRRVREFYWPTSVWDEFDYEFNRIFSHARRFF